MIRLTTDRYDNEGWAVKARKSHWCEGYRHGSRAQIMPGQYYYRAVSWPGSDANGGTTPWIMKLCRDCMPEAMRAEFDSVVDYVTLNHSEKEET